jgi:CRP/FNR family cyclic AMP-dependent transcriptional regulator
MAIRVKVAQTPKELTDVYKLRYQVYVEGEGYFKDIPGNMISDHFDSVPGCANIIAYSGDTPVATMRANLDSEILLPSDEMYDFGEYRKRVAEQAKENDGRVLLGSAGMLAIAQPWRNRRDVFRALFKMCCDVGHSWDVTHIISTVNVRTAAMYKRLRFEELDEKVWLPEIGEHIVPMGNIFEPIYEWAFGAFADKHDFLENFTGCFQYLLVSSGSEIFLQDQPGDEAYLISKGTVNISRSDPDSPESLSLATLSRGDMFGELSLIDDQPRSATAKAVSNVELVVLNREAFWQKAHQDPQYLKGLLQILTSRLRDIDQRAFVYAHGSVDVRLTFFINKVLESAVASVKSPGNFVAKITIEEFAYMASAPQKEAASFLLALQLDNRLKLNKKEITFHGNDPISTTELH